MSEDQPRLSRTRQSARRTAAAAANNNNNTSTPTPNNRQQQQQLKQQQPHHQLQQQQQLQQHQQQQLQQQAKQNNLNNHNSHNNLNINSTNNTLNHLNNNNNNLNQLNLALKTQPLSGFQKLASLLDYPQHHFQLPGLQNRLLLSLKSTIPGDTHFALDVLLTASFSDPELIPLTRFPAFVEPLIGLIELYRSPVPFEHQTIDPTRRRALESALILRNLLSLDSNLPAITLNHPRLVPLFIRAFHSTLPEFDHEFLALLLDILHSLASHNLIRLTNSPANNSSTPGSPSADPLPPSDDPLSFDRSSQLISGLDQLTQSFDRALVLGAFRALTAIGSVSTNHPALSSIILNPQSLDLSSSPPPPWSKAIDRALILLALPDVELLMSVLEYLYMITSIPPIAHAICTRHPAIYPILKLLLAHLHHHRKICSEPAELLPIPDQKWYFQPTPPSDLIKELLQFESDALENKATPAPNQPTSTAATPSASSTATPQSPAHSEVQQIILNESQIKDILHLPEPRRAQIWMARAFEACPGAEVQQVTLWLAYKHQFEGFYNNPAKAIFGPNHPIQMIAPADAIKLTSDVFPNALPSVIELRNGEKKFIISGMRVRPKKHATIWNCHWKECTKNPMEDDAGVVVNETLDVNARAERLYQHIVKTHITPRANKCHWLTCTYQATTRTELIYHVRTHIPSIPPQKRPPASQEQPDKKKNKVEPKLGTQSKAQPFRTYIHQRWETPNSGTYSADQPQQSSQAEVVAGQPGGGATGIGFVSLLVIRNLVQSVSDSLKEHIKSSNNNRAEPSPQGSELAIAGDLDHPMRTAGPDGAAESSLINLAQLIAGVPSAASTVDPDRLSSALALAALDDHERPGPEVVQGAGFVEKDVLGFLLHDIHLSHVALDLLKIIPSIALDLQAIG